MTALPLLREAVVSLLQSRGIRTLAAFPATARRQQREAVAVVSLQEFHAEAPGFCNYLGERFEVETNAWQEVYGQAVSLRFALDLYGPRDGGEAALQALMDKISDVFTTEKPAGLSVSGLSWGEMNYDRSCDLFCRNGNLLCEGTIYALYDVDGSFLSFEMRGGITLG